MRDHYLFPLFSPQHIAVVGASDKLGSVGQQIFSNLLLHSKQCKLTPVNLRHKVVGGFTCVPNLALVKDLVDVAVVTTRPNTYLEILSAAHKVKIKYIVLIRSHEETFEDYKVFPKIMKLAKKWNIRILGPSFLGMMRLSNGLNISTYSGKVNAGKIALISQSSSMCTAILDWSANKSIGFSTILSFGDSQLDIEIGEVLDFLVHDKETAGILLHIHHVKNGRKLMSALRAIARVKPVIVIKSGRAEEVIQYSEISICESVEPDKVFARALSRAGVLQVKTFAQMFVAAKILAANYRVKGNHLAVVSNGSGLGVLAADTALDLNVPLAQFTIKTQEKLQLAISGLELKNPIDILGDASPLKFRSFVQLCLNDDNVHGVLVIFSPQSGVDAEHTAQFMVQLQKETDKPILVSWLGSVHPEINRLFTQNHSLQFNAPEYAVEAFKNLTVFHQNQILLKQIPPSNRKRHLPHDFKAAKTYIAEAYQNGRYYLSEAIAKKILEAFHILCHPVYMAKTKKAVGDIVTDLNFPLVLKAVVASPIPLLKINGIILNIKNKTELLAAYDRVHEAIEEIIPDTVIEAVSIQEMINQDKVHSIQILVTQDKVFGPVIQLKSGQNTTIADVNIGLPPLNDVIIDNMLSAIKIHSVLEDSENIEINKPILKDLLLNISDIVAELAEIQEMKLDVLIGQECLVYDAKILLKQEEFSSNRYTHMAIMPYPYVFEKELILNDGTQVYIRPIRDTDAELVQNFVRNLSDESRYNRFMSSIKQLSETTLLQFTQLDYDREIGLVMVYTTENQQELALGIARYVTDPDMEVCEFAVSVADDWQGKGIATILMNDLFQVAHDQGLKVMRGEVLTANNPMQILMRKLGFDVRKDPEDRSICIVEKTLYEPHSNKK